MTPNHQLKPFSSKATSRNFLPFLTNQTEQQHFNQKNANQTKKREKKNNIIIKI